MGFINPKGMLLIISLEKYDVGLLLIRRSMACQC